MVGHIIYLPGFPTGVADGDLFKTLFIDKTDETESASRDRFRDFQACKAKLFFRQSRQGSIQYLVGTLRDCWVIPVVNLLAVLVGDDPAVSHTVDPVRKECGIPSLALP